METLWDILKKGGPGLALVFVAFFAFVIPLKNRLDTVTDELNREVLPIVNLLAQKEGLQAPQLRDLGSSTSNGDIVLSNVKVVGVDPQANRVFIVVPAFRRTIAVPLQIASTTKITDDQGKIIPISAIKTGARLSATVRVIPPKSIPLASALVLNLP